MNVETADTLYNIYPELLYAVDRVSVPSWKLSNSINAHNLMLVYDGRAEFTYSDITKTATKGSLIYYKPGDFRVARTFREAPMKCYAVEFMYTYPTYSGGEWSLSTPSLPLGFYQKSTDAYLFDKVSNLFSSLTKNALSSMERSKARQRTVFSEILYLLFQNAEGNSYNYSAIRKVRNVIRYMTEHFDQDITLNHLSDYANVSQSYLGKIFKSVTGKSPINYLIEIRINKAKCLLQDGFSVTKVSRLVGFNDIYYFSRTFKKLEGLSPSAYMAIR